MMEIKIPKGSMPLEQVMPGLWVGKPADNQEYYGYFETTDLFQNMGRHRSLQKVIMDSFKEEILKMSETQLDSSMRPLVEKWVDPPTALQVLEVLDWCIHGSLASGFVIALLQVLYELALEREKKTHDELEPLATWRK